jgi:hypothetical protein
MDAWLHEKIPNPKSQISNKSQIPNLKNYMLIYDEQLYFLFLILVIGA